MTKQIPALTMSGGTLKNLKDAKEFRVWVHPKHGDDYYYRADNLERIALDRFDLKRDKSLAMVEEPLAVVWDKKYRKYREVGLPKKLLRVL